MDDGMDAYKLRELMVEYGAIPTDWRHFLEDADRIIEAACDICSADTEDHGECPACDGYLDIVDPSLYCPHCGEY
jgi:hypothetical protein